MFEPCVNIKHHKLETPDAETRENRSLPRQLPKRSGTCFTMVWIIECRATDSLHKNSGNDTSLPSKQKKISHKEALDLTTRQNNCKPGTMSKQNFDCQICLTNLLFPNITSIKHRMERQERTGHFHVNSKEEWNIFYDGVKNRVQSNRQFTQDIRQWHKSSIEAEKKTQGSIGPYNTPNSCKPETDSQKKITFHKCSNHVLISNIISLKRQMQRQERTGHFHVNSQRGVEHVLRWCE